MTMSMDISAEGLCRNTMSKLTNANPLILSLSMGERSSFDKLRTNGNLFVMDFMKSSIKGARRP
jgi:hypothetical protein